MARVIKTRIKNTRSSKKIPPLLSIEERLKIFANLLVDQLIEDQKNGKLEQFRQEGVWKTVYGSKTR